MWPGKYLAFLQPFHKVKGTHAIFNNSFSFCECVFQPLLPQLLPCLLFNVFLNFCISKIFLLTEANKVLFILKLFFPNTHIPNYIIKYLNKKILLLFFIYSYTTFYSKATQLMYVVGFSPALCGAVKMLSKFHGFQLSKENAPVGHSFCE